MKKLYSKMLIFILSAVSLAIIPQFYLSAQLSGGGYSEPWMLRNVGARPIALAGVYSAIVNEPSGIFYNPAGTAFMDEYPSFNSTVSSFGLSRTSASLSYAQQILPQFGIGLGVNNFYSGSFTSRNKFGDPLNSVNNNQIMVNAAAAYRLEFLSMGAGFKYVSNSLNGASISANGVAFDLGAKLNVLDLFTFGLAMNNIGGTMKWNTPASPSEKIPYIIRTGVATEFALNEETRYERPDITGKIDTLIIPSSRYIMLGLDAVMTQFDKSPSIIIATELVPMEFFALRGGISIYGDNEGKPQLLPMNNWGAGVSLRPDIDAEFNINIDYSVSSDYLFNNKITHHIAILFEL